MDSFTLPFNPRRPRLPRLALRLAAVAFVAWLACVAYTMWLNPEMRFLKAAARTKQHWAERMTREHGAKVVVMGGSSCTFSIDGQRLLERHQMPAVNMGLFADMGSKVITEWALSEVKPGDTLVVALEPKSFSEDTQATEHGIQFCAAMQSPQWVRGVLQPHTPFGGGALLALRPGGYHACTLVGKILKRLPLFRYAVGEIQPSGWVDTPIHRAPDATPMDGGAISPSCGDLLRSLADWSRTNRVRLCYSLPIAWSSPEHAPEFQRYNAQFLLEVSRFLPVLKDDRLGAHTNADWFADDAWHLTAPGAEVRTDELAEQLRAWRMWEPEELRAQATNASPK